MISAEWTSTPPTEPGPRWMLTYGSDTPVLLEFRRLFGVAADAELDAFEFGEEAPVAKHAIALYGPKVDRPALPPSTGE